MYRIIGADQKEYGPVTAEQLRAWIAEGRVNAQTRVLPEGGTEWKTIAELPEFTIAPPPAAPVLMAAGPQTPAAATQVERPATGLMVVAILGAVLQAISLVFNLVGASVLAHRPMPNQPWANMFSGTVGALSNGVGIVVSVVVLMGAIKMKKLENYGLAMAASILALIPCISPCCLIGLPIGIWALVVLAKPEVKSAFH
jgi:hypothetical protein